MSGFLSKVKETLKDPRFGSKEERRLFKTGFDVIDTLGARVDTSGITYGFYSPGLIGFIGKSGTAKSTVILQTAWNVCQKYEDSSIIWLDYENSMSKERIKMFTGVDINDDDNPSPKFEYKNVGISIESAFDLVSSFRDQKVEYFSDPKNLVENKEGIIDPKTGKPLKIIPPTFIVIDSIRAMTSERLSLSQDDGSMVENNMFAAQIALKIGQFARHCMQACAEANIIIPYVNHIQTAINTGYTPKPKYLNYLKQDESLGGGDQLTYYTTTMVKLIAKSNLTPDDTKGNPFRVKGFDLEMFLVKSRDNVAGQGIELVFDQTNGFDNDICLFKYLDSRGVIKSAGAYKKLDGYDKNFRAGDFKKLMATDEEFRIAFTKAAKRALDERVRVPDKYLSIVNGNEVISNVKQIEE